jgi:hypothetical protein
LDSATTVAPTATDPAAGEGAPSSDPNAAKTPAPAAKEAAPSDTSAASDGKARITLDGPTTAKVGDEVSVAVRMDGASGVGKVRTQLRFDPTALQVVSADAGDVAPGGKVDVRAGGIQLDSNGAQVGASGNLLNVRFKVLLARPTITVSTQVVLMSEEGTALAATQATPIAIAATQ